MTEINAFDQIKLDLGAKVFGMFFHPLDQFGPAQTIGEARIILDFVRDGNLPAQLTAGDDDRRQLRAGGVQSGGQAGRAGANNHDSFFFHLSCLIS